MAAKKISLMGEKASFHDEAAKKYFKSNHTTVYCNTFSEACRKLATGQVDYCLMAIENSVAGAILPNYKLISQFRLHITGELYMRIQLHLIAHEKLPLKAITEIQSHPMAILQAEKFVKKLPGVKLTPISNTAAGAKKLAASSLGTVAVIAGDVSAEYYGLKILKKNVESVKNNFTRFLILSTRIKNTAEATKATISFNSKNLRQSLYCVIKEMDSNEIKIKSVHSIPVVEKRGQQIVYLDLEFSSKAMLDRTLSLLRKKNIHANLMGIYPTGEQYN